VVALAQLGWGAAALVRGSRRFAAVGVAVALFLLRIAASPRSEKETTGVLGNRIGAGVIALLSVLLLYKGISAEGMTDLKTCSDSFDVS